ncbi:MAG TPA: hypothetical protein VFS49_06190 [Croceibacterium sp.]|nr:hypothetical protein [Croceibacterium sp.]
MPNIDVSTYFFTAVVPVCNEGIVERGGMKSSPIHVVREVLETLPTALQSHATEAIGINSPFARNLRTHFARIVVLDQPNFNGRDPSDAVIATIMKTNLLAPRPVDQIPCPYILVMIDFDLHEPSGAGEPRHYLEELWRAMEPELKSIFQYCYGFERVGDAAGFASYMIGCQVETTMPFHDYWYVAPKLASVPTATLIGIPLAGLLVPLLAALLDWIGWPWAIALALALLIAGLAIDYRLVLRAGARAFPAAPGTSLRHVLKGLYLQQAFARFAIGQQQRDRGEWGAAFRAFLATHRPGDLDGPTQPPGVIRSRLPGDAA